MKSSWKQQHDRVGALRWLCLFHLPDETLTAQCTASLHLVDWHLITASTAPTVAVLYSCCTLTQSNALSPRWQHIYIVAMDTTSLTLCMPFSDLQIKVESLIMMSRRARLRLSQTQRKCKYSNSRTCGDNVITEADWLTEYQCVSIPCSMAKVQSAISHFISGNDGCLVELHTGALVSQGGHWVHGMRWMISMSLGLMIWYSQPGHWSHCLSYCSSGFVLLSPGPPAV